MPEPEERTAPRLMIEMVACGKASCKRCKNETKGHGQYKYLVKYSAVKVRDVKKYVGKATKQQECGSGNGARC
jgi:hypothetical protein